MATPLQEEHGPQATKEVEAELEEVRRELAAKRARNGGVQLAALFAVVLALAALVAIAFKFDENNGATSAMHNQMRGNMPAMMGAGSGSAAAQPSASVAQDVTAQLGDYWVRPDVASVPAGKVTFSAKNVGQVPHELMVERAPIKMDAPGQPSEEAAQGMIEDLDPGKSGRMTLNLKPGSYMLFCNLPGHYSMGQHTTFEVTG
jgi:uncharacterized cupredoxin-like copper-binding protein